MKIIFLDIDGVLNSDAWFTKLSENKMIYFSVVRDLDKDAVKILNRIIKESGAKIVISSSWRLMFTLDEIKTVLKDNGFEFVNEIIDITPKRHTFPSRRGNEIQEWITVNQFKGPFVIIDDDGDMEHLMDRLVQTSWSHGLKEEHIPKCLKLLNQEVSERKGRFE